jgi:hypothetical protein
MLAGCATAGTSWNHPTKDEQQFEQERYDCVKDGVQHAANLGFNGNRMIIADRKKECMRVKGYTFTMTPKKTATPAKQPKQTTPDAIQVARGSRF